MKRWLTCLGAIAFALTVVCQAHAGSVWLDGLYSTGVYDEAVTRTNQVDYEAVGNAKTLAQFKSDVAAAFANGTGGVITFDLADPYCASGTSGRSGNYIGEPWTPFPQDPHFPFELYYGASQTEYVQMQPDLSVMTGYGSSSWAYFEIWPDALIASINGPDAISGPMIGSDGNPIPGDRAGYLKPWGLNEIGKMDFVGGSQAGMGVVELAFTHLSAGPERVPETYDLTAIAYFSGGGSTTLTAPMTEGRGLYDTFFSFAAPPGEAITSFSWEASEVEFWAPAIDDLGIIVGAVDGVIPEPSTFIIWSLLGTLGIVVGWWRRRRA